MFGKTTNEEKTIKVDRSNAKKAYALADQAGKKLLSNLIPELVSGPESIKTFNDACHALGLDPETRIAYQGPNDEGDLKAMIALHKLQIIARALNEGWKPDWKNTNQLKYYPWFEMDKPGVGFSYYVCVFVRSGSDVGSRLCYKSRELAEYAGKQFRDLYKDLFTF